MPSTVRVSPTDLVTTIRPDVVLTSDYPAMATVDHPGIEELRKVDVGDAPPALAARTDASRAGERRRDGLAIAAIDRYGPTRLNRRNIERVGLR